MGLTEIIGIITSLIEKSWKIIFAIFLAVSIHSLVQHPNPEIKFAISLGAFLAGLAIAHTVEFIFNHSKKKFWIWNNLRKDLRYLRKLTDVEKVILHHFIDSGSPSLTLQIGNWTPKARIGYERLRSAKLIVADPYRDKFEVVCKLRQDIFLYLCDHRDLIQLDQKTTPQP